MKTNNISTFFIFLSGLLLLLNGCATAPLERLSENEVPVFDDDLNFESLLTGAVRHLHYLDTLPATSLITLGPDTYPVSWMRESMNSFIDILKQDPNPEDLARTMRENYIIYQAGGRKDHPKGVMLFTGYYEPFLKGSLTKEFPYIYPLFSPPESLVQMKDSNTGATLFKRKNKHNQFVPYWTREEIENNGLADGNELVYLDDPVDAFILHVQGSGKIQLQDGSVRSIHYAASNGLEYFSIGKLLVDQEKMSLEEVSIPTIRTYLKKHPEEQSKILNHNIKYIFFNWAPDGAPAGSLGEPLVAERSIAIDPEVLPHTALAFLISRKPVLNDDGTIKEWIPMHRFVFPQDTGSAIKGPGRADLYWGSSNYAKTAAGSMKEEGTLYFLVKNNFEKKSK
ncbi:MAG: MltA domain-containing protein [Desulfocapsa sp.]|nr:MltA domain-containing protein [Desulfocapsa sp.]